MCWLSTSSPRPSWGSCSRTSWWSSPRVQTDPVLMRIAKKTKMVFPLYNEEIHILGRAGIAEFDDLSDRRVAIGREGSETYLTARLLFNVVDVTPREIVMIDTDEALAELKAGRIDAMFYVADTRSSHGGDHSAVGEQHGRGPGGAGSGGHPADQQRRPPLPQGPGARGIPADRPGRHHRLAAARVSSTSAVSRPVAL
jgi:hypothetical protein